MSIVKIISGNDFSEGNATTKADKLGNKQVLDRNNPEIMGLNSDFDTLFREEQKFTLLPSGDPQYLNGAFGLQLVGDNISTVQTSIDNSNWDELEDFNGVSSASVSPVYLSHFVKVVSGDSSTSLHCNKVFID